MSGYAAALQLVQVALTRAACEGAAYSVFPMRMIRSEKSATPAFAGASFFGIMR
jgi:hypothetical protein